MIENCNSCTEFTKKSTPHGKVQIERSFTKIDGQFHFGFDRPSICQILVDYVPETIILAGNGAVTIKGGENCWKVLEHALRAEGIVGQNGYRDPLDGFTWIAAQLALLERIITPENEIKKMTTRKANIIKTLIDCDTQSREMYCTCCDKKFRLTDSKKTLILTTNWDLGLLKEFSNVIQVHGRCDYPEQAILPLQNISSVMAKSIDDIVRLNCGILPATFLDKCLTSAKKLIFWGTGLHDYDALLWHFLNGFSRLNQGLEIGIACKDAESFADAQRRVSRFFPNIPINNCICRMLPQ